MRNIILYYIAILLPFLALLAWMKAARGSWWPIIALFVYGFLYRPLTDGYRLYRKGVIGKKEIKKMFDPFSGMLWDHFRELYLKP